MSYKICSLILSVMNGKKVGDIIGPSNKKIKVVWKRLSIMALVSGFECGRHPRLTNFDGEVLCYGGYELGQNNHCQPGR